MSHDKESGESQGIMQTKSTWDKLMYFLLHIAWMIVLAIGTFAVRRFEQTMDKTSEALNSITIRVETMQAKLPTEYPPAIFSKLVYDSIDQNRREHERIIEMIDKLAARRVNPVAVPKP